MRIIKNDFFKKLLMVLLVVIILFNFIMPRYSYGASVFSGITLFNPIRTLICGISDAIFNLLQDNFLGTPYPAVEIRSEAELKANGPVGKAAAKVGMVIHEHPILTIAGGTAAGAGIGAFFGGPAGAAIGAGIGATVAFIADLFTRDSYWDSHAYPLIEYTPSAIFSNTIPIFDINFIRLSTSNSFLTIEETLEKLKEMARKIKNSSTATLEEKNWAEEVLDYDLNSASSASPRTGSAVTGGSRARCGFGFCGWSRFGVCDEKLSSFRN